jgi:intracellular sulfur oxidation DsrE/DsrF family protein
MPLYRTLPLIAALAIGAAGSATAQDMSRFGPGPAITNYGQIAPVPGADPLPAGASFKVVFDVSKAADAGQLNRSMESAARFLNLQVAAGVPEENIKLAIVVHGPAARDLVRAADGELNPNAGLIAALIAHGVRIYVCGQTAAAFGIEKDDLLPGVHMALSAMTAHALLQQEGYSLNPF